MLEKKNNDWLHDAIPLGVYRSSSTRFRRLVNRVFEDIAPLITVSSRARQKDALKTVLTNLYHAHRLDKPVRYSRDRKLYTRDRRYGQLFFKYDRLIPIIDALERVGFLEQKTGYFIHEDGEGKQTRMWGTDKLWKAFQDHRLNLTGFYKPAGKDEPVILRDEHKQEIGYRETPQTRHIREDLELYNRFIRKHKISVRLEGNTLVDNRFLVEDLYQNIVKMKVWIKSVEYSLENNWIRRQPKPIPFFNKHKIPFHNNPKPIINILLDKREPSTITHTEWAKRLLSLLLRRFWSDEHQLEKYLDKRSFEISRIPYKKRLKVLAEEFLLRDIGVESLEIALDHEQVYRIFNRSSWKLGGRAYGALHQDMVRRHMRKLIRIDGQPTVEVDFSAYHIRMLYHMEGTDYPDDPYSVCEGPEMRDTYKAVGLVAINAESDIIAYGAIRKELKKRGIPLPQRKEPLKSLVKGFREAHKPIEHYLFSGIGLSLQNSDSMIMNAILVRLMDHGVLGLSVYDSVIVAERHADFLKEVMTEEYTKVMGFKPRF